MLTTLLTFLKTKIFTMPVIFLTILVSIISIFLLYNSDTILTKLGFETKTALKAQVISLQKDLEIAQDTNKKLMENLKTLEKQLKDTQEVMNNFYKEEKKVVSKVTTIKNNKTSKEKTIAKKVEEKQTTDEKNNTLTLPLNEVNEHSSIQISSLNEVYDELFERS